VLLDDGELDRVRVILERLASSSRCVAACGRGPPAARARPAGEHGRRGCLPGGAPGDRVVPLWLCIHGQDFGERASCARSSAYLVNSAVDQSAATLIEMLFTDSTSGVSRALPVGCEVSAASIERCSSKPRSVARWPRGCAPRARRGRRSRRGELPQELRGAALTKLVGRVVRAEPCPGPGGRSGFSIAVELEPLAAEAARELEAILTGANPATRISALAEARMRDRRRAERRAHRRRVAALSAADAGTPRVALGHDLSVDGIRIARQPGLTKGVRVAIGLYGAEGAPLTLEAEVVADHGPRGSASCWRVTAEQRARSRSWSRRCRCSRRSATTPERRGAGGLSVRTQKA
jgi:hypothetical protein